MLLDLKVNNAFTEHLPVLAEKLNEQIELPSNAVIADVTIGHGGHSCLLAKKLDSQAVIFAMDVDEKSLIAAERTLAPLDCRKIFVRENFSRLTEKLKEHGIEKVDLVLADLGVCSAQLTDTKKGLSFQADMPLDMRLDNRLKTTAADIVNKYSQTELANLIYKFGQERASRKIARSIVQHRQMRPIRTTAELAFVICRALGVRADARKAKTHPATKTFQALRIVVNDELQNIRQLMEDACRSLAKDGKIAVISFHSLEDKIVKEDFKSKKQEGIYQIITKKPIIADSREVKQNPRSRSAKLRIARKII